MEAYSADRSLKGKLRRRLAKLAVRRPATVALDRPMVSFCFDDAPATAADAGAALLEAGGLRGTYFICAGTMAPAAPPSTDAPACAPAPRMVPMVEVNSAAVASDATAQARKPWAVARK